MKEIPHSTGYPTLTSARIWVAPNCLCAVTASLHLGTVLLLTVSSVVVWKIDFLGLWNLSPALGTQSRLLPSKTEFSSRGHCTASALPHCSTLYLSANVLAVSGNLRPPSLSLPLSHCFDLTESLLATHSCYSVNRFPSKIECQLIWCIFSKPHRLLLIILRWDFNDHD